VRRPAARRSWQREQGFTLIELMTAIAVLALLLAIAVPSFRDAALGSRLAAVANSLLASVQLARSEAIKRNVPITLCVSSDGSSCAATGGWEQGWVIRDPGGLVIDSQRGVPADLIVREDSDNLTLVFQPIGIGATAATFTVCRPVPVGGQERRVTVTATGSTFVTITNSGDCS
jgi:type IV fimbrial biogenesis protein FimT